MAVRTGVSTGVTPLAAATTDTVIMANQGSGNRSSVTAATLYNTTGGNLDVSIYESANDTSASGELLDTLTVPANDSLNIAAIIGQGFASGQRIIAVAGAGAVLGDINAKLTLTQYTAGS